MSKRETVAESAAILRSCFVDLGRDIDLALGYPIRRLKLWLKRG